ncbi:MAG: TonB C-terminal domain-containing protein [Acidobacteriota bacterium]|jgi:outer membrane biosynthesis protein TonB|nr:TonB C-terminal domain-containing protein [Acidobacteriota bacterium]
MSESRQGNLLGIPLIEEKYGRSVILSIALHILAAGILVYGGLLLPSATVVLGTGAGGGMGGDAYTVGVIDELSGGMGMVKPSLVPQPPALLKEPPAKADKAIPLPGTDAPKKPKPTAKELEKAAKISPSSNVIPTAPEPGSGGVAGRSGGSGGGMGGGIGISIGSGTGGFGDHWYAQRVEARISSRWLRPPEGVRVEMVYSFFIAANGTIYGIKKEKSSGNLLMDLTAERAIRAANPLSPPPQEFRGRAIQFIAQFVHPPNP